MRGMGFTLFVYGVGVPVRLILKPGKKSVILNQENILSPKPPHPLEFQRKSGSSAQISYRELCSAEVLSWLAKPLTPP